MKFLLLLLFLLMFQLPTTDTSRSLARKALQQDQEGVLDDAEVNYKRALKHQPFLYQAKLNLGNTLYRQERYKEALNLYQELSSIPEAPIHFRAKAYYNLGTTYLRIGKLQESRNALQEALKLNSSDEAAIYNLAYVIKLLTDKKREKQPEDKTAKGENSPDTNEEGAKEESKNRNEENKESDQQLQEQQQENIEQMLKALDLNERNIHDKIKRKYRTTRRTNQVEKDW